jgi:hypothetical protein
MINSILGQFITGNVRDFPSFETFIIHLLRFHIENQKKKFYRLDGQLSIGDAIAPDGFGQFKGPTLITIKFSLNPTSLSTQLNLVRLSKEGTPDFKYYLVVVLNRTSPESLAKFESQIGFIFPDVKLVVWGPTEIERLINRYKSRANQISENLFRLQLDGALSGDSRDWKKEREERINLLKICFDRGQFSLFLGAGVSSSAGLPDWSTLLNSLFVKFLTSEFQLESTDDNEELMDIVERLNTINSSSALIAARYLRKGYNRQPSEKSDFTKAITDSLYNLRDSSKSLASSLIMSITDLCMPRRTGAKVKSVITYNFDDLLERQLRSLSIAHRSIFVNNDPFEPDELPVYHVHGFLPENVEEYVGLERSTLVFSEEGYHQIYTESYHWSNLVQLANLRENNCLMVGLSLADPNLRRLLDISARDSDVPRHFAFMQRTSIENFKNIQSQDKKMSKLKNIETAEQFLERHHRLNEEVMKDLGISVIWFESFDEIPRILDQIHANAARGAS